MANNNVALFNSLERCMNLHMHVIHISGKPLILIAQLRRRGSAAHVFLALF